LPLEITMFFGPEPWAIPDCAAPASAAVLSNRSRRLIISIEYIGVRRATARNMRSASVRDLHIRTSELVRGAADGGVIVIERRGEPVAELRPLSKKRARPRLPDLTELWQRFPAVAADSGRFLEEDR
jgi:prevent-host-death family protein